MFLLFFFFYAIPPHDERNPERQERDALTAHLHRGPQLMPAQCITPVQLVVEERLGLHPYCTKRVAVEAGPNGDSVKH